MNKKMIGILVMTMLIATTVPEVISTKGNTNSYTTPSSTTQYCSLTIWNEIQKLTASDGTAGDWFGVTVSLSGDTALIGAPSDDDNGVDSGSAYVFTRTGKTWTQQTKLTASDGTAGDWFGVTVSLSGDTALIGAYNNDAKGSVYVFTRTGTTWTQQAKLTASDGTAGDWFGVTVSLSGDTALIGAPSDDDNGVDSGSAYVFTRTGKTWTQQTKLTASDGASYDWFGWSISLSGDTALIGAVFDDDNGYNSGSAYIFNRTANTWTQQTKLTASDGLAEDCFGRSVSLSGDTALVGADYNDDNGPDSGAAYLFIKNKPPEKPTITGKVKGKLNTEYDYKFISTDPEGNSITYCIDWGDNTSEVFIGPYPSGTEVSAKHTWLKKGNYAIKAKAKDFYGAESDWATFDARMPKTYIYNPIIQLLLKILERFPLIEKKLNLN